MMSAFSRLFIIGMGIISFLVLLLFGLRYLGLQREFEAYDHPLLKDKNQFWIIAKGGGGEIDQSYTEQAMTESFKLGPHVGVELPLRRSSDGVWFVFPGLRLEEMTNGEGIPEMVSWNQLSFLDAGFNTHWPDRRLDEFRGKGIRLLTLKRAAEISKGRLLLLTFFDPNATYVQEVVALINSLDLGERVIIRSPFTKFVREMKKVEPLWLYGSDSPGVGRAMIFDNLKIETLISFQEDIIVSPISMNNSLVFTPTLTLEIQRQQKSLILELEDDPSSNNFFPEWIEGALKGVLTSRPIWALKKFRPAAP